MMVWINYSWNLATLGRIGKGLGDDTKEEICWLDAWEGETKKKGAVGGNY